MDYYIRQALHLKCLLALSPQDLWFTSERQHKLRKTFANCTELLICSGQLKASLHYWLRNEIAIEASLDPEMCLIMISN